MNALPGGNRVRASQIAIVGLGFATLAADSIDFQMLSYTAPAVMADLAISKSQMGVALGATLGGMIFGALIGGSIGDRIGRRPATIGTIIFFGLASLLTAAVHDVSTLVGLRLLAGIGFGVAYPNVIAICVEWMPKEFRSATVASLSLGAAAGGLAGASIAAGLIDLHGWRACFLVTGAGTMLLGLVALFFLHESPAYLASSGKLNQLQAVLGKVVKARFSDDDLQSLSDIRANTQGEPRTALLSRVILRTNASLWGTFFFSHYASFAIHSWLTVIMVSAGFPIGLALLCVSIHGAANIAGTLFTGAISSFVSRRILVGVLLTAWIVAIIAFGFTVPAHGPIAIVGTCLAVIGFSTSAYSTLNYAMAAELYPTVLRARGLGSLTSVGRGGGVLAAVTGGALLSLDATAQTFIFSIALALLLSASAAALIPPRSQLPEAA